MDILGTLPLKPPKKEALRDAGDRLRYPVTLPGSADREMFVRCWSDYRPPSFGGPCRSDRADTSGGSSPDYPNLSAWFRSSHTAS